MTFNFIPTTAVNNSTLLALYKTWLTIASEPTADQAFQLDMALHELFSVPAVQALCRPQLDTSKQSEDLPF